MKNLFDILSREEQKEKKHCQKELLFFLDYYKEVAGRSEKMKIYFDEQIEFFVEMLKLIGR